MDNQKYISETTSKLQDILTYSNELVESYPKDSPYLILKELLDEDYLEIVQNLKELETISDEKEIKFTKVVIHENLERIYVYWQVLEVKQDPNNRKF